MRVVRVLACVLAAAVVAVLFGLAPAALLAAAYGLFLVARAHRPPAGLSAVAVGGVCAVGVAGLALTGSRHHQGGTPVAQVVFGVLVLGIAWAAGSAVRERREGVRRVVEEAAERAKAEERLRIARDIHDVVTHSVGLIAVKAGIANHVVATHPEEAQQALAVIEDVSRAALRDLRATLKVLRGDEEGGAELRPAHGLADLPALARTAESTGVRVTLRTDCPEPPPGAVALCAYRIVQEALTNVVKHAAPTRCRIHVAAEGGVLSIEVVDDGPGAAAGRRTSVPGGGHGIAGMRERAAAHGGVVTAGPRPGGGFRVEATLPY